MNRRRTLKALTAGAAAAVVVPVAAQAAQVAPGADAELIALCDRFTELEKQWRSYFTDGANPIEDDDERGLVQAPLRAEQKQILDRVTDMDATTLDGIRARLRMTMAFEPSCYGAGGWDDYMLEALLNDMQRVLA